MYVKRNICPSIIFYFSWRTLLFAALLSTAVYFLYSNGYHNIVIPFLPVATVGTAVAFYVGFKNNSSYDRLWEARKVWGEIVNSSRSLAAYLLSCAQHEQQDPKSIQSFIYRQIAYTNMLRIQLRRHKMWNEEHLYTKLAVRCICTPSKGFDLDVRDSLSPCYTEAEIAELLTKRNIAKEILFNQMQALSQLKKTRVIDHYEHSDLMRFCSDIYAQQGKTERIKNFPFPRQYAYFSEVFTRIFFCLLPFGLVGEFAKLDPGFTWLTIPFSMLISWIFDTMEKVGDTSENPFENGIHDIPMTSICRSLETDLREMLQETDLPQPVPILHDVLM